MPFWCAMSQQVEPKNLCGFLNIEETELSGTFCRRYFILDLANRKLAYYMDSPLVLPESWKNPVGEIYLQYINNVHDARKKRPKVPFSFVVSVAGRQYFLQAEDAQSMEHWIDALNNASKITVPLSERPAKGAEWHAGDLSQTGYVTEIAGGVVCKIPMQIAEDSDSGSEYEDNQSRSSSGKMSSANSSPRQMDLMVSGEQCAPRPHKSPAASVSKLIPVKAGYAVKQGAVRKNWKRRYFILHEGGLSYFKSEHEQVPLRTVAVSDILQARQAEGSHFNRDNLLEILTNKRIFYLQGDPPPICTACDQLYSVSHFLWECCDLMLRDLFERVEPKCDSPAEMYSWIHEITAVIQSRKQEERKREQKLEDKSERDDDISHNHPQTIWV